jgi:uncharacterized protein YcfJ
MAVYRRRRSLICLASGTTFKEQKMEINQSSGRLHPLVAGAAVSVMLVSLVGVAAITGLLPNSHGNPAPATAALSAQPAAVTAPAVATRELPAQPAQTEESAAKPAPKTAAAPAPRKRTVHVVHHYDRTPQASPAAQVAQAPSYPQPVQQAQVATQPAVVAQQPVQQQPVAQHSPIGIATGAVIGGVLGNQVGGGNGKTLATVAGAIGGGYLGDVIGKRYGY